MRLLYCFLLVMRITINVLKIERIVKSIALSIRYNSNIN